MSHDPSLILPTVSAEYVLPTPPRHAGDVLIVPMRQEADARLQRGGEVARSLGEHFSLLAETQQLALSELRDRLAWLDGAVADASRAQLKGAIQEVRAVLDWCDAMQAELVADCQRAARGWERIDSSAMAQAVAAAARSPECEVLALGSAPSWWGDGSLLARLLQEALGLVLERTQGNGVRVIEVSESDGAPCFNIYSRGEPSDSVDPRSVQRFRGLVARLGAHVAAGSLGVGGAGMRIRLPIDAPQAAVANEDAAGS
jgi:hypothetical protein